MLDNQKDTLFELKAISKIMVTIPYKYFVESLAVPERLSLNNVIQATRCIESPWIF